MANAELHMNVRHQPGRRSVLDLGCGNDKLPGAVGIDANPRSQADVIHDLDVFPWPFKDDTFDEIRAQDVLEHVVDLMKCMAEIHRVSRDGAIVHVRMPFMGSHNYATDPTHRRSGASHTFDYFDESKPFFSYRYSDVRFEVLSFHYERHYRGKIGWLYQQLDRVLLPFLEKHNDDYEHYGVGLYPMHNICYELRVAKRR